MTESTHFEPERLSAYLEGELSEEAELRIREHLEECRACGAVIEELREVVRRAGDLEDREPERDLWPAVEAAITSGRSGRRREVGGDRRFSRRRFALSLPQAAAAVLVLVSLSAGTAWLAHPEGPGAAPSADPVSTRVTARLASDGEAPPEGYAEELARLEEALRSSRDDLEPNTVRVLEKNLEIIDRAIRESRRALEVDPGNSFLEEHLERAYRTKLEYLRQVSDVTEWSS